MYRFHHDFPSQKIQNGVLCNKWGSKLSFDDEMGGIVGAGQALDLPESVGAFGNGAAGFEPAQHQQLHQARPVHLHQRVHRLQLLQIDILNYSI